MTNRTRIEKQEEVVFCPARKKNFRRDCPDMILKVVPNKGKVVEGKARKRESEDSLNIHISNPLCILTRVFKGCLKQMKAWSMYCA